MASPSGGAPSKLEARKWVLVVDDNARLRALWIEVLEEAGYRAIGSEDGLAAGDLMRDLFPDLILLDLRMPRASGWDFSRTSAPTPGGTRSPGDRVRASEEGPDLAGDSGLNIGASWPSPSPSAISWRRSRGSSALPRRRV